MGKDSAEHDSGLADHRRDADAHRPETVDYLRARLAALPDWHPSSQRYQLDHPQADARHGVREGTISDGPHAGESADAGRGGWDVLSEQGGDRPPPGDIRVSAERRAHILDGDKTGGGHRHGMGSPGKTEFPADWEDAKVIDNVLSVARTPDERPVRQNWNDRWRVQGEREGVGIVAIVTSEGLVWAAWPREGSPGVVKNKPEDR